MAVSTIQETYRTRRETFSKELTSISNRINTISNFRIVVALLFVAFVYLSFSEIGYATAAAFMIVVFLFLVKKHASLFDEKIHLENLVRINTREGQLLNGDLNDFDEGNAFTDVHHVYAYDLDIFGRGSLYQYLSRCHTLMGQASMAMLLRQPLPSKELIEKQQQAVQDISERIDFRQDVEAAAMTVREHKDDHQQLLEWVNGASIVQATRAMKLLLYVLPAISLTALFLAFFLPQAKLFVAICVAAQWIITGTKIKKINILHDSIGKKKAILEKYAVILNRIEKEKFSSSRMTTLSSDAKEAHKELNNLASLVSAFNARTNVMAIFFVNSFLLYDLQCVYRIEKWRQRNREHLTKWLGTVTTTEVLVSIGTFAYNNPSFCFPRIVSDLKIEGNELGHPLIFSNERITNNFSIGSGPSVLIITGANMAGKSTFLRTVGINMVLALSGAPVCASSFTCPVIKIRSGMRTADSLTDHQSYFFAELNRLKSIMDELRSGIPLLILLDEILKGTNSNDKQNGSIALVKQLLPYPGLAIIATHDLALGELENQYSGKIKNYCFEANIENDQLSFDYLLKEGVAQKMNASFLMKKMGILDF